MNMKSALRQGERAPKISGDILMLCDLQKYLYFEVRNDLFFT